MRFLARVPLLALLVGATMAVSASAAQAAPEFGVESFYAANCKVETCNKGATPAEDKAKAEAETYGQAAGHPPFGVTDFKLNRMQIQASPFPAFGPVKNLKNLRIDVAPGVSTNPEAVAKCSVANFTSTEVEPVKHIFLEPNCGESGAGNTVIGENIVHTVTVIPPGKPFEGAFADVELKGKVYNLEQPTGMSSYFGVALVVGVSEPPLPPGHLLVVHTFIEGHVEWASDYHDLFEIHNIAPGLLESRLLFYGNNGPLQNGAFLSNPSTCGGPGPLTTTGWSGESYEGAKASTSYTVPVGTEGCNGLPPFALVPFAPTFSLTPETTQSDQPDGVTTELVLPHDPNPANLDSAQLKTASVLLPEGMTLNPSAAHGLEACTPKQIGIHTMEPVTCPAGSKVAEATLNVPGLPPGSLTGAMYLGGPEGGGAITGPPFTVYLDAESTRYGISVRLQGQIVPDETTGRLTATFAENPEQPFSDLILSFTHGPLAPIANPLACGIATTNTSLAPYTGQPAVSPLSAFTVDSDGKGGACPAPLPFSLSQSTQSAPPTAGAQTSFTLNLERGDGQQYLSQIATTLPAGLVGLIPSVPLCGEPQAARGECPFASQIGTAVTQVGSGPTPVQFSGPVFLTGPVGSAPYGMTVEVSAATGPFNFGLVVVRAGLTVNPYTARVTVSSQLPTIVKGVPLRMKKLAVAINRQGFLINPTNCGVLATESALGSTFGASQSLSSPFQATNCGALAFKPKLTASSNAKASKKIGASLGVKIGYPAGVQSNIRSTMVQLPKQLPSRLTTLQHACPAAVFNANPFACPSNSRVGGATVTTPVLPVKLTGPAFFVSHGGAAFPDLDLVLNGSDGVETILVGNTNITNGITTSTFAAVPDVPVSSFEVNLPTGPNSALAANGSLCAQALTMPTTITAQSGAVIKQNTPIVVAGCSVKVTAHKTSNHMAILTVQAPSAGRVSGSGSSLKTTYRHTAKAQKITLKVPLSSGGVQALARSNHNLKVKVRVGFIPSNKSPSSVTHVTVTFRG
jgi:hypothetical protein